MMAAQLSRFVFLLTVTARDKTKREQERISKLLFIRVRKFYVGHLFGGLRDFEEATESFWLMG